MSLESKLLKYGVPGVILGATIINTIVNARLAKRVKELESKERVARKFIDSFERDKADQNNLFIDMEIDLKKMNEFTNSVLELYEELLNDTKKVKEVTDNLDFLDDSHNVEIKETLEKLIEENNYLRSQVDVLSNHIENALGKRVILEDDGTEVPKVKTTPKDV